MSGTVNPENPSAKLAEGISQAGTDLATWQAEMASLQAQYAANRAAWRESMVGPLTPIEKRKKGRPA